MHLRLLLLLVLCSIGFESQSSNESNPELDKLLEEVKQARSNFAKAELPDGVNWSESYYSSGLFYLCSNSSGLYMRDEENELPTKIDDTIYHIEFTAKFSAGDISIIEVHSVNKEQPSHCSFAGQAK